MNPYLRIKQPIRATTYFFAEDVLEGKWPEMEPTSSRMPTPRIELSQEFPIGSEHPLFKALAVFKIYIGDELLGSIRAPKAITINKHGVFRYHSYDPDPSSNHFLKRLSPILEYAYLFIFTTI